MNYSMANHGSRCRGKTLKLGKLPRTELPRSCSRNRSICAALLWSIFMVVGGFVLSVRHEWGKQEVRQDNQTWAKGFIRYHSGPFSLGNGGKELYVFNLFNLLGRKSPTSKSQSVAKNSSAPKICWVAQGTPFKGLFGCTKISPSRNNIFFLETSCAANQKLRTPGHLTLTAKQACSVYSAAHYHPHRNVILLLTCPLAPQFYSWTKAYMKPLFDLPNFSFGYVELEEFYSNSSLLEFYRQDLLYSQYPIAHNSDLLRLFVLFHYGGTYLDLDVISLRSLDDLGVNYIGKESPVHNSVGNGVMNFEPRHEFLRKCLLRGLMTYDASKWNTIGPHLMTTSLQLFCNITVNGSLQHSKVCNITILPVNKFYAVNGNEWSHFYNASLWPEVREKLKTSYVAHYWNHEGSLPLRIGSDQPIIKLAQDHCANVYKTCTTDMQ